jgi:hypothetical protein
VFKHVWRKYFRRLLGFTKFQNHRMCNACSEIKAKMPPSIREGVLGQAKVYVEHNEHKMRDRPQVYCKVREQSTRGQVVCIMQDGSDQSKYRIVRVVETPK